MRLYEYIEDIFQENILEKLREAVKDFQNMHLNDFYLEYKDELDLESCYLIKEFADIEDGEYVYKISDENEKKIIWI